MMPNEQLISDNQWTEIIKPKGKWFDLKLKEVWDYRDLISIFVRRDVISSYKQTILGPIWFFLGPLLTVVLYTFVFGSIANIPTDGIPAPLFYLAGTTLWNYFANCFSGASSTFTGNAHLFGKVYFPRLVAPLSMVISNLLRTLIQFIMFMAFWVYYYVQGVVDFSWHMLWFPYLIVLMALLALGIGIAISAFTTKYRDLNNFIPIGVNILMYASPVIYPTSLVPAQFQKFLWYNPLQHIIDCFRYAFTGGGHLDIGGLMYSTIFTLIMLLAGIMLFNRTERTFMDTV
jgi:lipopolysaccharide transport system permease protein